jgi:hypothetical protein
MVADVGALNGNDPCQTLGLMRTPWVVSGSRLSTPKSFGGCKTTELPSWKAAPLQALGDSSSTRRAQDWLVLAVLTGFLEVRERWKERLSRTTTKDEDDLCGCALHGLSPQTIRFVTRSSTNESATLGVSVPDSPERKTAKNSPVSLCLLRSIVIRVKPKSVSL